MKTHPPETLNTQVERQGEATPSTRRAIARKGAKLAFVLPAAVALKVNVASAGFQPVGTGVD